MTAPPRRSPATVAAALAAATLAGPSMAGDAGRGEALFSHCGRCHEVGETAFHGIGPALNGIAGGRAASAPGYAYSPALAAAGAAGLAWSDAELDRFIADPEAAVPGSRMSLRGVAEAADRADLVAYLGRFAELPPADGQRPVDPGEPAAASLAIDGDPAYGAYLASECVTCHQASGASNGIPSIVGWDRAAFVRTLFDYRTGRRAHDVMKNVTGHLGDAEIAALAAHFATLGQ